jgi:hypothetical protein
MGPHTTKTEAATSFYKPLSEIPDVDDLKLHKKICDPRIVTERLQQLVPLLKFMAT